VTMQVHKFFRNHLCSELVSVIRISGRRSVQALVGNLEEIGEWSALVLTQTAVSPGTRVRVKREAAELKGFVRSCTFDKVLGFFIDIGLDAESRWSEKWFVPAHLFALCPSMRYLSEPASKVPEKFFLVKTTPALKSASR
jgi:hypothetical protein